MVKKVSNREFENRLKRLGGNIKKQRAKKKLTQEMMSELTGIDYKYYQRIEYGEVNITVKTLLSLCDALAVKPKDLINFE